MWHNVSLLNGIAKLFFFLFIAIVCALGFFWCARQPFFSLQRITIFGTEGQTLRHVNELTVRSTAIPHIKGNFFTVNLENVREIFKTVPWVRDVTIRRKWPNGLEIWVEEHKPLGTWRNEGQLISVKGDVFTANIAEAEDEVHLLKFRGPEGSEKEVVGRYYELKNGMNSIKLEPVFLELSERYAWKAILNNGMTVRFGREEEKVSFKEQLHHLLSVYPRLSPQLKGSIKGIDLRYPNGLALDTNM